MKHQIKAVIGLGAAVLLLPVFAFAQTPTPTSTSTPTPTASSTVTATPSSTPRELQFPAFLDSALPNPTAAMVTGDLIRTNLAANRSYECQIFSDSSNSEARLTGVEDSNGNTVDFTTCGNLSPQLPVQSGHPAPANTRLCFTTESGGNHFVVVAVKSAGENVRYLCFETTLYSGFNTSIADFNFLELTNTTSSDIVATVTAINFSGDVVIDGLPVNVPANGRFDVDLHTPAGPGVYGLVIVTHNGPKGALQGQVSEYEITSVTPLDFTKTGATVLRSQL